jgi:hypothetical protein
MALMPRQLLYFDAASFKEPEGVIKSETEDKEIQDKNIYCAVCGFLLTTIDARFTIDGSSEHTFTNPHGYVYTINCFKDVPGVVCAGEATEEYTWFKGFSWRYAFCGQCTSHLGWMYSAKANTAFYGLIKERLSRSKKG